MSTVELKEETQHLQQVAKEFSDFITQRLGFLEKRLGEIEIRERTLEKDYLTLKEAGEIFSISESTFRRFISEGRLHKYKLDNKGASKVYLKRSEILSLYREGNRAQNEESPLELK